MNQIQLYRIFSLLIFISMLFSKHVKPNGKEELFKLSGISNNSTRSYYRLDRDGLSYSKFKKYVEDGENAIVRIISRSQIAPNSNSKKSFGYKLIIKKGKKTIISKELKYNKRASKVSSTKQKGFYFTEAGFWIEEFEVEDKMKIYIKPLDGSSDAFIRLVLDKSQDRVIKDTKIKTLNRKQNYSIEFESKSGKKSKSHNWYVIDSDESEKIKLEGPIIVRFFSRYIYDDNKKTYMDLYSIIMHEDEKWVSEYNFIPEKSNKNAKILNKDFEDYSLGKYKSFYYNVPAGTHYYTIKIPNASNDNKFLFKIEEYELK